MWKKKTVAFPRSYQTWCGLWRWTSHRKNSPSQHVISQFFFYVLGTSSSSLDNIMSTIHVLTSPKWSFTNSYNSLDMQSVQRIYLGRGPLGARTLPTQHKSTGLCYVIRISVVSNTETKYQYCLNRIEYRLVDPIGIFYSGNYAPLVKVHFLWNAHLFPCVQQILTKCWSCLSAGRQGESYAHIPARAFVRRQHRTTTVRDMVKSDKGRFHDGGYILLVSKPRPQISPQTEFSIHFLLP